MKYFDTHAHYNDKIYKYNVAEVLDECRKANVEYIVNVGYDYESSKEAISLSEKYDYMYAAIGIHPSEIYNTKVEDILNIYNENKDKKIVAMGECGLDYSYRKYDKEIQKKFFIEQIELANFLKLPIILHTRDASKDTYDILKYEKWPEYNMILHCFNPTEDLVRLVLEKNYTVAFGGNITYPRKKSFGELIQKIPLENIVIETDCPYLAPVPHKGEINSSKYLPLICKRLAEYLKVDEEKLADVVYNNAKKFFKI